VRMAVYVDDVRRAATVPDGATTVAGVWSHMTADTTKKLLAVAEPVGVHAAWAQDLGTWKEHFDVTESRRNRAVESGAISVRERGLAMVERRELAMVERRELAVAGGNW
jgi:hypothetical protein